MSEETLHPAFKHNQYMFRRKFFKLFGAAFHIYDQNENVVFYSKQKAFKLREDFRIYSDETQQEELLAIKTPEILDIGATYYVLDSTTGAGVGALRRKAFKSILKDEWIIISAQNEEIGTLTETSMMGAILSRIIKLIPQSYVIETTDGRRVANITQHFNPFILKYTFDIPDSQPAIDRRLIIAAGVLLASIEGRQQ